MRSNTKYTSHFSADSKRCSRTIVVLLIKYNIYNIYIYKNSNNNKQINNVYNIPTNAEDETGPPPKHISASDQLVMGNLERIPAALLCIQQ